MREVVAKCFLFLWIPVPASEMLRRSELWSSESGGLYAIRTVQLEQGRSASWEFGSCTGESGVTGDSGVMIWQAVS